MNIILLLLIIFFTIVINIIYSKRLEVTLFYNNREIGLFAFTFLISLTMAVVYFIKFTVNLKKVETHNELFNNDRSFSKDRIDIYIFKYILIFLFFNEVYKIILFDYFYFIFIPYIVILYHYIVNSYFSNIKVPIIKGFKIKDYMNLYIGKTKIYEYVSGHIVHYEYITVDGKIYVDSTYNNFYVEANNIKDKLIYFIFMRFIYYLAFIFTLLYLI